MRINRSIVPLYLAPDSSVRVDEGLYGMKADFLEQKGTRCKIRMFYGYEGWAEADTLLTREPDSEYPKNVPGIVTAPFADVLAEPKVQSRLLLSVPRGALLKILPRQTGSFLHLLLWDGRAGYVPSSRVQPYHGPDCPFDTPKLMLPFVGKLRRNLVKTAGAYCGVSYRWGGKTAEGIDCSGLTFMAYYLNGILIYRDAELKPGFPVHRIPISSVLPGDLLYFPGHVAMYKGNGRYIHATAGGTAFGVTENSLFPLDPLYRKDLAESITAAGSIFGCETDGDR